MKRRLFQTTGSAEVKVLCVGRFVYQVFERKEAFYSYNTLHRFYNTLSWSLHYIVIL